MITLCDARYAYANILSEEDDENREMWSEAERLLIDCDCDFVFEVTLIISLNVHYLFTGAIVQKTYDSDVPEVKISSSQDVKPSIDKVDDGEDPFACIFDEPPTKKRKPIIKCDLKVSKSLLTFPVLFIIFYVLEK